MSQIDEPFIGYGEFSYCTDYIKYGSSKIIYGKNKLHKLY